MNPRLSQAHSLLNENKPDAALAILQRLSAKAPQDPDINTLMGMILLRMGRLEQALFYTRRAAAANNDPSKQTNLAIVLIACHKEEEGLAACRGVLAKHPDNFEARLIIANVLMDKRRADEAIQLCREGLAYGWHAQLSVSYAAALISMGENEEAVKFLRQAVAQYPSETYLAASLALAVNAMYGADPDEIAQIHRDYGALLNRIKPPFHATYIPKNDPEKRLRIALLSPDLRQHSVAFFIEPFLEHFDRARFDVVCYYTNRTFDAMSARLKSNATLWRDASAMIELQLAPQLSADQIDIAIDLAGHTEGHSLLSFSLRMAPIQMTYLGYPDTTGLTQMDFRIVDSHTDPLDPVHDARSTEKLLRMDPCFLCYRPPAEAPDPIHNPQSTIRNPVFGSFNASRKTNQQLAGVWSRILKAVPESKLALKALDFADPAIRQRILARFAAHGIGPERLELLPPTSGLAEHLAQYSRVDLALDPIPYNGTTTTCEALWMGVPVVTMAGNRHAGRVGVSLLSNIGAPELIATDEDDYVKKAVELAQDRARLDEYRRTLRQRMAASPLCDSRDFARRFENLLRQVWRSWCEGQSAGGN